MRWFINQKKRFINRRQKPFLNQHFITNFNKQEQIKTNRDKLNHDVPES